MRILILLLLAAMPAWAQNAGGKGYDHQAQAEFDRRQGIRKIEIELRRLIFGNRESLGSAVSRYISRATKQGHEYRLGFWVFDRLKRKLAEEVQTFSRYQPEAGQSCMPGKKVGASSPERPHGAICFDIPVLAEHYFDENLKRGYIPPADRLLATTIHELAHNQGEPESEEMLQLTHLVEQTASMGWKETNLSYRGNSFVVDLKVGSKVYIKVSGADCLYGLEFGDGHFIHRDRLEEVPFDLTWNSELERYENGRGEQIDHVLVKLKFVGELASPDGCRAEWKFYDSLGVALEDPVNAFGHYVDREARPYPFYFELRH
ncbi:MAG TPA: hypothetical protein VM598_12965 [Bdellovibrionota bacterium]|nr:hypothetical protein [Bdellovibrionota bacterium]